MRCRTRCEVFWPQDDAAGDPAFEQTLAAIRFSIQSSLAASISAGPPSPVASGQANALPQVPGQAPSPGARLLWLAAPAGCAALALVLCL